MYVVLKRNIHSNKPCKKCGNSTLIQVYDTNDIDTKIITCETCFDNFQEVEPVN